MTVLLFSPFPPFVYWIGEAQGLYCIICTRHVIVVSIKVSVVYKS